MATRRKCSKCGVGRADKFYVSARGRVCLFCQSGRKRSTVRDVRIMETYGITRDEYQAILKAQGGVCAICGGRRRYNYDVDHDHALVSAGMSVRASVRGLLCRQCNRRVLRSVRDSVPLLRAAIEYLQNPPAQQVIGKD